jgi:hypothetical protein
MSIFNPSELPITAQCIKLQTIHITFYLPALSSINPNILHSNKNFQRSFSLINLKKSQTGKTDLVSTF